MSLRTEGEEAVAGVVCLLTSNRVWGRTRDLDGYGIPVPHAADLFGVLFVHPRFQFAPPKRGDGVMEGVGDGLGREIWLANRSRIRLGGQTQQLGLAVVEGEAVGGGVGEERRGGWEVVVVVSGREEACGVELGSVQHVWRIPTLLWAGQVFSGRSRSRCVGRGDGPRIRDEGVRRHDGFDGRGGILRRERCEENWETKLGNVGERWRKNESEVEEQKGKEKTSSR